MILKLHYIKCLALFYVLTLIHVIQVIQLTGHQQPDGIVTGIQYTMDILDVLAAGILARVPGDLSVGGIDVIFENMSINLGIGKCLC